MEVAMNIEIHTHDKFLAFDLLGKSSITAGDEIRGTEDVRLKYNGSLIRKAAGFPEVVNFVLTFGSGVTSGVVANWLYDKLKRKK